MAEREILFRGQTRCKNERARMDGDADANGNDNKTPET